MAGCLGARYYSEHKEEIDEKLKGLKDCSLLKGNEGSTEESELTLEELETQKERLEDLIADVKSRQAGKE